MTFLQPTKTCLRLRGWDLGLLFLYVGVKNMRGGRLPWDYYFCLQNIEVLPLFFLVVTMWRSDVTPNVVRFAVYIVLYAFTVRVNALYWNQVHVLQFLLTKRLLSRVRGFGDEFLCWHVFVFIDENLSRRCISPMWHLSGVCFRVVILRTALYILHFNGFPGTCVVTFRMIWWRSFILSCYS